MALETLRDVKTIDGFPVTEEYWEQPENTFIEINHKFNAITFKIQDGPIKEVGVNGCQVDTILWAAYQIIKKLNQQFPCDENESALEHIFVAYGMLKQRKNDREERGVEGTYKK